MNSNTSVLQILGSVNEKVEPSVVIFWYTDTISSVTLYSLCKEKSSFEIFPGYMFKTCIYSNTKALQ